MVPKRRGKPQGRREGGRSKEHPSTGSAQNPETAGISDPVLELLHLRLHNLGRDRDAFPTLCGLLRFRACAVRHGLWSAVRDQPAGNDPGGVADGPYEQAAAAGADLPAPRRDVHHPPQRRDQFRDLDFLLHPVWTGRLLNRSGDGKPGGDPYRQGRHGPGLRSDLSRTPGWRSRRRLLWWRTLRSLRPV